MWFYVYKWEAISNDFQVRKWTEYWYGKPPRETNILSNLEITDKMPKGT